MSAPEANESKEREIAIPPIKAGDVSIDRLGRVQVLNPELLDALKQAAGLEEQILGNPPTLRDNTNYVCPTINGSGCPTNQGCGSGGKLQETVPATQHALAWEQQLIGCVWITLHPVHPNDPPKIGTFGIEHAGTQSMNVLDIKVDGKDTTLTPPDYTMVAGKNIQIHLQGGKDDVARVVITQFHF